MRLTAPEEQKRRQKLWKLMRKMKQFTAVELARKTGYNPATVREYLYGLKKAGYVRVISCGRWNRKVYELVKDAPEPPRVKRDGTPVTEGIGREQMWRSIRILKQFSLEDIVATSNTEEQIISKETARKYLRYLVYAGYLVRDGSIYILVKNTGPKPPQVQRIQRVYDPNLKEVVWPREQ